MILFPDNTAFIAIGILLAASVYLSHKSFLRAFLASLLFVPLMHKELFSLVIWDLLPIRIFLLGTLVYAITSVVVWMIKTPKHVIWNKVKDQFIKDPFFVLLAMLLVTRGVSLVNSEVFSQSAALFAFYSLAVYYYLLFKVVIKENKENYFTILNVYLFIGLLAGIFAVIQFYLRMCCRETIGGVWVVPNVLPRLGSTFWDVNHYGGYLITLIPLAFSYIFISESLKRKFMYVGFLGFLSWLLFMTQSRSAWIGIAVGMLISLAVYYWTKLKKPLMFAVAGLLLGSLGILIYSVVQGVDIKSKISRYMHYRLDSTDTHFMLLDASAEIFHNNFFIGSGYGTFDYAFRQTETASDYFDREPKLRESRVPSHSVWGEVLAESGAVGVTLYASFIVLLLSSLIYSVFNADERKMKYLGIGVLGSVISVLTAGIFYSYNMEFFWISIFLGIGYVYVSNSFHIKLLDIFSWWSKSTLTPYLIIVPPAVFFTFIKLGSSALIDVDEAIYAKVAKNMVMTGEWLSLRWDNLSKYWFEKPPLYMWLTALMFKLVGYRDFAEFAARFWSAVAGVGGVILVYRTGAKMYNRLAGIFSALLLLSTIQYVYYSRNGMLDVSVTFFILLSFYFFYRLIQNYISISKRRSIYYSFMVGLSIGFGILTKGIIGLLLLPTYIAYLLYLSVVNKNYKSIGLGLVMIIGATLIAGPWHILQYIRHGSDFLDDYFFEHVLKRGVDGLGHIQPPLWYLTVIKTSFRLWLAPLLAGIVCLPFIDKNRRKEYLLLMLVIVYLFSFFTYSRDKLQWYIMPMYPFLALIAGRFSERFLYWANNIIKNEFSLDHKVVRFVALIGIFVLSVFTLAWNVDKIYYPDANRDKAALIEIHNDIYPVEDHPDKKLYYNTAGHAVVLFYSDHRVSSISGPDIVKKIEDAEPDEALSFLTPNKIYYSVKGEEAKVDFPLSLDVKGSAGDWVLFKSRSRVEIYKIELGTRLAEYKKLELIPPARRLAYQQSRFASLRNRIIVISNQLVEWGNPPEDPTALMLIQQQ